MLRGNIDLVKPEGIVEGWCWDEQKPTERIEVTILVDGIMAGNGLAALYREDLRQANVGDGFHKFAIVLQDYVPSKRATTFTLVETSTRAIIGEPFIVHTEFALTFDDRLMELENKNRLLETRLNETVNQFAQNTHLSGLFSVIGSFFISLSEGSTTEGILDKNDKIGKTVRNISLDFPMISIDLPESKCVTILIEASSPLHQVYACLAALHRARAGLIANVVVLDPGVFDDVAFIPSVVRNISYVRTISDLATEWMEAACKDSSNILVMLSGRAIVHEAWLSNLVACFDANPTVGAVGGYVVDEDGTVRHGGLCVMDDQITDCAVTHPDADANLDSPYTVHALSHHAVALRRQVFQAVGGLDLTFGDNLGVAIIDLCFRLGSHGWSIMIEPSARLSLLPSITDDSRVTRSLTEPSRLGELLRIRWFSNGVARFLSQTKRALVIGDALETTDELLVIALLQKAHYTITYIGLPGMAEDRIERLQQTGASVNIAHDVGSTLIGYRADIVYAMGDITALEQSPPGSRVAMSLEQLRTLLSVPEEDGSVT